MKDLRKKVGYVQGLMAGLELDEGSKEGRIISAIVDLLDEMADALVKIKAEQAELESYVESIDEDLYDLENEIYAYDYEDDGAEETPDDGDRDEEYVEVECPNCHDIVCFDADILDEDEPVEVICPNCEEVVFVNDEAFEVEEEQEDISLTAEKDNEDI
ncbi:CD1247 N-terminal domain-containing protein [Calderihabitans maritimus]|uniref:AraC family transcriptional regulator n=1 Tax=Calderihabitans maritimus TaxID=1246530 RepID=A0A1Z5HXK9_9FIRM|nr:CD1247 N-terminal domain-containing protein [Calderihabitans maritimus]GAW94148.1 hypothetical protein TherJR_1730 [Calderihabitans maritimus]